MGIIKKPNDWMPKVEPIDIEAIVMENVLNEREEIINLLHSLNDDFDRGAYDKKSNCDSNYLGGWDSFCIEALKLIRARGEK